MTALRRALDRCTIDRALSRRAAFLVGQALQASPLHTGEYAATAREDVGPLRIHRDRLLCRIGLHAWHHEVVGQFVARLRSTCPYCWKVRTR